ncbi:MAG: zf-HC2 domain-containing protein [Acidobacteriota bacterium]
MSAHCENQACEETLDRLEDYVDGELEEPWLSAIAAHLETCSNCRAEHRLAVAVQAELRALPELDAPASVLDQVLAAESTQTSRSVLPWRRASPVSPRGPLRQALLAAAVLATAVLAWALILGDRLTPEVEPEPTPAEIARATAEARIALAYLAQVSHRTGLQLRDDVLVDRLAQPTLRSLARVLPVVTQPPDPKKPKDRSGSSPHATL